MHKYEGSTKYRRDSIGEYKVQGRESPERILVSHTECPHQYESHKAVYLLTNPTNLSRKYSTVALGIHTVLLRHVQYPKLRPGLVGNCADGADA